MTTKATPGALRLNTQLGQAPTRAEVDALMKRCQIGVGGRHALDNAHSIMAECYGTLGRQQIEIERLRAALGDILNTMGPKVPPCCEGCEFEWLEAITIARKTLEA